MVQLSRLSIYGIASTSLFLYTVLHAFRQRSNFYAAAVYLSKSNACTMILWNQGIFQTVLFGKFLQAIFFGELRLIEVERLQERGWFAVTETLLALTIFKDEFDSSFVLLFITLLFLKIFHWLAADRIELMEQSAHIPRLFHLRMGALLAWLWIFDALLLTFAVESILLDGPTVMIMFASEYMILLAMVWSSSMKYGLNVLDMRSEEAWEEKSIYVFYVDLATDFFKLVTYLSFFGLILTFYGLPLNILRDVYITFRSFILKIRDLRRYRQATRNMDTLYPNATAEEMERMVDKMCIICREDMEYHGPPVVLPDPAPPGDAAPTPTPAPVPPTVRSGPNETPKKLPCGHVFHFHCLRSWLERQQSCPTCRRPVLPSDQARVAPAAVPRPVVVGEEAIQQAQINLARNLGREAFAVVFPGIPFPEAAAAGPVPAHNLPAEERPPPPTGVTSATPGGDVAASSTSSSTPGATASGGLGTRTVQTNDNPLARFSLPELRLPPTGEAALYSQPPYASLAAQNGYAGVAYGAYPQTGSRSHTATTAQAARVPNLEERLAHIRMRMTQLSTSTSVPPPATLVASIPEAIATPTASSVPTPTTTTTTTPTPTSIPTPLTTTPLSATSLPSTSVPLSTPPKVGLPTTPQPSAYSYPMPPPQPVSEIPTSASRREQALAAAERRLIAARANGPQMRPLYKPPPPPTPPAISPSLSPLPSPPPSSVSSTVSSSTTGPPLISALPPTLIQSETPLVPATGTASSPSLSPPSRSAFPRIIPLFNSSNTAGPSTYPHLFSGLSASPFSPGTSDGTARTVSMQPLIPVTPTEEQFRELSKLTRSGIEERLRVLVGFQDRMAALAKDMNKVLSILPEDDALPSPTAVSPTAEEASINVDKGKAPAEGARAEKTYGVVTEEGGIRVEVER